MAFSFFNRTRISEQLKPISLSDSASTISIRISCSGDTDGEYQKVDIQSISNSKEFELNYNYWKEETMHLSVNNLKNAHFEKIVSNGSAYLPFIYADLEKGETALVHALEQIFPNQIPYDDFVSLKRARKLWLKTLKQQIL